MTKVPTFIFTQPVKDGCFQTFRWTQKDFALNNVIMKTRMKKRFRWLLKSGVWVQQSTLSALAAISTAAPCSSQPPAPLSVIGLFLSLRENALESEQSTQFTFDPAISVNTNIKHRDKQPYKLTLTPVGESEEPDKYGFDMWEEAVMGEAVLWITWIKDLNIYSSSLKHASDVYADQ